MRVALFVGLGALGFAVAGCGSTDKSEVAGYRCIDARDRPMPMISDEAECKFEAGRWHATPPASAPSAPRR